MNRPLRNQKNGPRRPGFERAGWPLLALLLWLAAALSPSASEAGFREQAFEKYKEAKSRYLAHPADEEAAVAFADTAFEWADFATKDAERAALAEEGIAAMREVLLGNPDSGPAHYLLALNLGQLARTKTLGALKIVREMEQLLQKAIELDPKGYHAGAHRSLGLLYLEAPGWPASIGSKSKARQHLEKALQLAPDHPENHLVVMEACVRWNAYSDLRRAAGRYRNLLPKAREQYSGPEWRQSWASWDNRWKSIREVLARN